MAAFGDELFPRTDDFAPRHLGPRPAEVQAMLKQLECDSLDQLTDKAVPESIRWSGKVDVGGARGEAQMLAELQELAGKNRVFRSYLGMGYHGCITPSVIQRNILENPGWYTQYTPYQSEISQGRLEAMLNFQTMVIDLTGMEVANASMLDEATAAAEAMTLCGRVLARSGNRNRFLVASDCHPQTIAVVQTRAEPLGIEVVVQPHGEFAFDERTLGALVQYPSTDGSVVDYTATCEAAHAAGALAVVAADLLSLTMLRAPGRFGADIVVGSSQRFGMPMAYGGPHAAFLAGRSAYQRLLPGRIVGVSEDADGRPAMRLALATREQHIRREKATSNICTAQVLPGVVASMFAVYHGPDGLKNIAQRVHGHTAVLANALRAAGCELLNDSFFDTLRVRPKVAADAVQKAAADREVNLRAFDDGTFGVAIDETVDRGDLDDLVAILTGASSWTPDTALPSLPAGLERDTDYLTHPVFHRNRSETDLLRYMHKLQARDLSLTTSMIALGSCTMKLNATTEMVPITWPGFAALHPFVPREQAEGYTELHTRLEQWLAEITGFHSISLQPNAGSQGEYAGLLVIRKYHAARGEAKRNVCLIPTSAHGTNPASAKMVGMKVVGVKCDDEGNIDVADLRKKAADHREDLAALMVTYPSTHGVFESAIREVCAIVHEFGGQVYLDGANMNAQVGLCRPGDYGGDVCHLNLHKTFCIPHGGGGPGMGPIGVAEHLAPFLPSHPVVAMGGEQSVGAIAAAPWGSPAILPISYSYIAMMGAQGLVEASQVAILGANYMAKRLEGHFEVLYRGPNGMVAHECIVDCRPLKKSAGIEVGDIAKRLMDYGFHAPTVSFPVAGTVMIEPTESESQAEMDRFCDAMIAIRDEIRAIEEGRMDRDNNPLKNAPHTAAAIAADAWDHPYSREVAAFPAPWVREHKYWPPVSRVDDVSGDRNLVCACPPVEIEA